MQIITPNVEISGFIILWTLKNNDDYIYLIFIMINLLRVLNWVWVGSVTPAFGIIHMCTLPYAAGIAGVTVVLIVGPWRVWKARPPPKNYFTKYIIVWTFSWMRISKFQMFLHYLFKNFQNYLTKFIIVLQNFLNIFNKLFSILLYFIIFLYLKN